MAKYKKRNGFTSVVVFLVCILLVGTLFAFTKGISFDVHSFAVKRNGKEMILQDKKNVSFDLEERFEIVNLSTSEQQFEVKIYAYAGSDEADFTYTYINESGCSWNDFANEKKQDFTSYFDIQVVGNTFSVKNTGFRDIVEKYDKNIHLPSDIPEGDRFVLQITCGDDSLSIYFSPYVKVSDITLPNDNIVF